MTKKKLLLIFPRDSAITYGDMRHVAHITGRGGGVLNAGLATIAALTPKEHFDITIVDEHLTNIDFDGPWDLVGMTGFPTQLQRAREIGMAFQKRGKLVVAGGSSVSVSSERWRSFCDVLFVGLAEHTWPAFLRDYLAGAHADRYEEKSLLDFADTPVPDYSGFDPDILGAYYVGLVQTSRGCPFDCEFCDAIIYLGRKMRYKPVTTVVAELEQIAAMGIRFVYLADDNFSAGRKRAKEILRALIAFNRGRRQPISFFTALSIDAANDDEFLELSAAANMLRVFVGLETPNEDSLRETNKHQNVKNDMLDSVRRFQEHGIQVVSGSMVGFDHDGLDIFRRQVRFFASAGVPSVQVYPIQAPDGTPLKTRLVKEGRYVDWDRSVVDPGFRMNNFNTFTVIPKGMSVDELRQGTYWMIWKLYELDEITERLRVFFDAFECSPKKARLGIPKPGFDPQNIGLLFRLARHMLTRATANERRTLMTVIGLARRSSHPQAIVFALGAFLLALNVRAMMREEVPGIEQVRYPERPQKAADARASGAEPATRRGAPMAPADARTPAA